MWEALTYLGVLLKVIMMPNIIWFMLPAVCLIVSYIKAIKTMQYYFPDVLTTNWWIYNSYLASVVSSCKGTFACLQNKYLSLYPNKNR